MTETATDTDADRIEEIRDILTQTARPLTVRQIAERCGVAASDVRASLLQPLRRMREAGDVVAIDVDDGKRVYRLADDDAVAADAPPPPGAAVADDPPAPEPPPHRPGVRDQVRAAVAEMEGEFTAHDIAARAGLDVHRASKTLAALAQIGELARRKIDSNRYAYAVPATAEDAAAGDASPPGRDGGLRARVREIVAKMPAPVSAADIAGACGEDSRRVSKALWDLAQLGELGRRKISGNQYAYFHPARGGTEPPAPTPAQDIAGRLRAEARYAYRSDGTLLIETAAGEACELDREETDRLYLYLTAIHRGLQAASDGSVTHG